MEELSEPSASLYCLDRIAPEEYFKKHMPQLDDGTIREFTKAFNLPGIPIPGINPPNIIVPNPVKWSRKE